MSTIQTTQGSQVSGGGGGGGGSGDTDVYSVARDDFTAARSAATVLALTLPVGFFTVSVEQIRKVYVRRADGTEVVYDPETNQFSWNVGGALLTVTGGSFLVTDLAYDVEIVGPPRIPAMRADDAGAVSTKVQPVKVLDLIGATLVSFATAARAGFVKLTNGTLDALLKRADTAGAVDNVVLAVQAQDLTGKTPPAGDTATNPVYTKLTDGAAAIATANPLPVRLSADGTNPIDATHPALVRLTDGVAVNAADHPSYTALSLGGSAVAAGVPLPAYNPKLGATYTARVAVSLTGASSAQVVAASARKGLVIKAAIANTDVIWLAWDTADAAATYGLPLEPGETREWWGEKCPTTKLNGLVGSATQTLYVEEIT